MGKEISSLAVLNESVFAAAGDFVGRYVRGKEVGRFIVGSLPTYDSDSESTATSSSSSTSSTASSSSSSDSDDSDDDDDAADPSAQPESLGNLILFGNTLVALSSTGKRMYVWDVPPYVKPASKDPLASNGKAAHGDDEDVNGGSETDESEVDDGAITPYATLEFPDGFSATKVVHPASYLNKVVVASKEGALAVWNVRTGCVHLERTILLREPA